MGIHQKRDHSKYLNVELATGSAVQATTSETWCRAAWVRGFNDVTHTAAPVANSSAAVIGFKGLGDSNPSLTTTVGVGETVQIDVPVGMTRDLSELWGLGTTGDQLHIEYIPA